MRLFVVVMKIIEIGSYCLKNCVVLVFMFGVSDLLFWWIVVCYGVGMVVSEMVVSEFFVKGDVEI